MLSVLFYFCFVDLEKLTCVLKVCLEMVNDSEVERGWALDLHFLISL